MNLAAREALIEMESGGPPPLRGVLRAYNPISWYHEKGIHRVLARLRPRLPDVAGCLFLTSRPTRRSTRALRRRLTMRDRLRRVFHRLRAGVEWEGKRYRIAAPYAVKVEFHANGWAHFHAVFLTRRYLPGELLTALWGLGRTDVRRINNHKFHYLLKYVTKGGGLPDWVLGRAFSSHRRAFAVRRNRPRTKRKPRPTPRPSRSRRASEPRAPSESAWRDGSAPRFSAMARNAAK